MVGIFSLLFPNTKNLRDPKQKDKKRTSGKTPSTSLRAISTLLRMVRGSNFHREAQELQFAPGSFKKFNIKRREKPENWFFDGSYFFHYPTKQEFNCHRRTPKHRPESPLIFHKFIHQICQTQHQHKRKKRKRKTRERDPRHQINITIKGKYPNDLQNLNPILPRYYLTNKSIP